MIMRVKVRGVDDFSEAGPNHIGPWVIVRHLVFTCVTLKTIFEGLRPGVIMY